MTDAGRSAERSVAAQELLRKRLQRKASGAPAAQAIPLRAETGPAPVSFAQERLWFLDRLEPGSAAYNLPAAILWHGPLRVPALAAALAEIVRRHEALRTTFAAAEGGDAAAVQVVAHPPAPFLPVVDLTRLAADRRTAEREHLAILEARRPFDLAQGPLLRTCLLRLTADEHILLATVHHIVSDGWSQGLLVHELTALYQAFAAGRPSPLPELPLQYADFAAWQRDHLRGEMLEAQLAWWRRQLAGAPAVLELPADRPRPALPSLRGSRAAADLPASLAESASMLSRQEGATLFMTLLAAFQALLCRATGQEDLAVGTPVAGRLRVETEPLIGLFLNTLVLRTDASGDPSFRELLGRVREVSLQAFAHQDVPFEKLVEELRPQRDLAHTPLFQVLMILQNAPTGNVELGELSLARLPLESGTAKFELTLSLAEGPAGLRAESEYRTDLFDRTTILRQLGHFENVLRAVVADPTLPISRLPLLAAPERQQALEWNDTARPEPASCLHRLIQAQAESAPDAVAVAFAEERLTYGQLDRAANRLARALLRMGAGPEVPVGIHLERSLVLPAALLAVWKAGGAYVPLDPTYPPERLSYMLEDSGAPVLLTQRSLLAALPAPAGGAIRVLYLDGEDLQEESADDPGIPTSPESLAYILYTSGSTGRPKGVQIPHGALINFLEAMRDRPGLGADDRLLAVTSLSFDIAGLELFLSLLVGAEVEIASREMAADGRRLLSRLEAATVLQATPSTWRLLLESGWEGGRALKALCGGEALPPKLAAEIAARTGSLWNMYGPTETAIWSAVHRVGAEAVEGGGPVALGRPIANTRIFVVDPHLRPVPAGVAGELVIGGAGLARGYFRRPDLTAERFVPDSFGARLYRTGDLARWRADGELEFLGRLDHQVKVRGHRIELGEIEAALAQHASVRAAMVLVREDTPGDPRLTAFVVAPDDPEDDLRDRLRAHLRTGLPEYMMPAAFVILAELPLLPNGKVDRKALFRSAPGPTLQSAPSALPRTAAEREIAEIWREVLALPAVGVQDNFFDLGGHSLLLVRVQRRLREVLGRDLPLVDLFRYPTVASLAGYLSPEPAADRQARDAPRPASLPGVGAGSEIAVIGMAGRFPGAASVAELWRKLCAGTELIASFSAEEGLAAGLPPEVVANPRYVGARGVLEGPERFDAAFFDYTPREAQIMDPQQRVFLETAWQALEDAGYDSASWPGRIGVYAGASENLHVQNVYATPELVEAVGRYQIAVANKGDYLASRVSYKMDLKGPSVNVQTACSTSLVAVHLACRSLLAGECDMALAGGVSVTAIHGMGYLYEEGGIASPDGHCRAFDAKARGTVDGDGAAVVVLKRLADALADGDRIDAVIKGSAVNNDGSLKVGFTAPSVEGQAEVIAAAQTAAGVDPASIGYVEAHGTGTVLGDPIEVAALNQAFGGRGSCAIGSVKTNLGHLDAAAGVAGLIKAVLAVKHGLIPPSLHYETPNPMIDFASGPFRVNAQLAEWRTEGAPRRAGVSSFGIGGTNAHVVLEEAPAETAVPPSPRPWHLLMLSAKTPTALEAATAGLAEHLDAVDGDLADIAFTLHAGRRALAHRRMVVCRDRADAVAALRPLDPERVLTRVHGGETRPVVFLFPGQGAQVTGMGAGLDQTEPLFRETLDRCAELLRPELGRDLRELLAAPAEELARTAFAQPALFAVEYALARLWMSWGVRPQAMIGHSLGEYAAACLAGVFSLEDGLRLVAARGLLMQSLPAGAMLGVDLSPGELEPLLDGLEIAAVNAPAACVVSGPAGAVEALSARLAERGVDGRRLHTSHAFHSRMMEPAVAPFREIVAGVRLQPPALPWISNLTGTWITTGEATDPNYWARHLRQTVRFADGLAELLREPGRVLLEVGPGRTLSILAGRHPDRSAEQVIVPSLGSPRDATPEAARLLSAAGRLWLAGVRLDAAAMHAGRRPRRVPLPTYPFERRRYWVEPRWPVSTAPRGASPALEAAEEQPVAATGRIEPRDATERAVAELWQESLGIAQVGVADDFFELGGHSLLATRLVSRLRDRLGVEVAIDAFFAAPTVAGMARLVTAAGSAAIQTILPAPRDRDLPLSFAQHRLWFLHQLDPAGAGYNMPIAVRFQGPLAPEVLERAAATILARHESLRTTFSRSGGGEPVQVISPVSPRWPFTLTVVGLEGVPAPLDEARRLAAAEARRPFDLERGPLWRLCVLRLASDDHVVALTMHHVISDGWSIGIFIRELSALYGAFARGEESPLPPLPVQYPDFAVWQRAWLAGDLLAAQTGFWRERLGGTLPVLELPLDRPRPPLQTFRGARVPLEVPADLAERLRALARGRGATLFMVLLAGFKTLLRRVTGQEDLLVGAPIAGRNRSELEGLIGFFVNTLVLRTDLSGDPAFTELLDRVRETTVGAYAHQDFPFEKLVEEIRPPRDLARSPLFQVMLGLENAAAPAAPAAPGLTLRQLDVDSGASRFEWTFFLVESGGGIGGSLEYNTDLFDEATVRRMAGHWTLLLAAAVADPAERLSSLPLLSGAEERQLLVEWNETARDFALEWLTHERIAGQAARRPTAPAVLCAGETLTYGELDARANRLAHRLRELGVGPEVPVGIYLERSLALPVALLATWKAGGAYVPLDPAYPRERLSYMLEDSGAPVLLTQESLLATVPPSAARVVCLEREDLPPLPRDLAADPGVPASPESLAYILYTSGSTGRPKGVQIPHGALVNFLESMRERPGLDAADRLLAVTSLSFDIAGLELFLPLLTGAEVEIASRDLAADAPRLLTRLAEATALQATPSTWRLLLDAGWAGDPGLTALCGGEALPPKLAAEVAVRAGSLWNMYGPTETTIWSATRRIVTESGAGTAPVPIGRPIANTQIYVVDPHLRPVPIGVPGELLIGGAGLARGYFRRPDLTAERFIPDPFARDAGARLYRTGDLARWLPGGELEFLGRLDHQVKVRGYRIELGEIEAALERHPAVGAAVVLVREDAPGDPRLTAYVVAQDEDAPGLLRSLRSHLRSQLPEYMVPSAFVVLPELPLLPNGKVDRKSLPTPKGERQEITAAFTAPRSLLEATISETWRAILGTETVGIHDNFFDLGGHSLLMAQVHHRLRESLPPELGTRLTMVELFQFPTVATLARHLRPGAETQPAGETGRLRAEIRRGALSRKGAEIAIVGMSGRFPGAGGVERFWSNLCEGVESISRFSEEELAASGIEPEVFRNPNYINARAIPEGIGWFDAGFFGYTPREAEIIDPQHRMFLEVAWEALENAACDPERFPGLIGVFAGAGLNTYMVNLYSNPELMAAVGSFQAMIGNDKDFLPTRVSYKLNLKGPSLNVQTACSTSLVAVHLACQHLLHGECDLALAGGVTLYSPVKAGNMYQEGSVFSPDGHCRAFDERSQGTVVGNGAAVVVLKRLDDALADGDSLYAVIKGSAINNDGSVKVGYTAPSVEGQTAVISQALAMAGVEPETIGYVEAHGTGTILGDPIEVRALTQAFRAGTDRKGFCGIGSVKTNVGHLDTAAGVAGLIKATLALERGELPPSLHFERPNPALGLAETPFYVNDRLAPWPRAEAPRRAGVSAFGIGGTNAHVILEEAPPELPSGPSRPLQLLVLSARGETALEDATDNLARHLREHPDLPLADVAYTLQAGRRTFSRRRTVVAADAEEAATLLAARDPKRVLTQTQLHEDAGRPVVFLFSGGGTQYAGMSLDLYRTEPVFREQLDLCLRLLQPHVPPGNDLRRLLFPTPEEGEEASRRLERTTVALPVLFAVEYALAKLWMSWGIRPQAMIGHSLGEYAVACLSGVLALEDAAALVALRGRLFDTLPEGGMLSVPLPEAEVLALLPGISDRLAIAAVNSPSFCVVSGPAAAITKASEALSERGLDVRRLHIAAAGHSPEVEPILREFGDFAATLAPAAPRIPYVSNVTGTWMTTADATNPGYWVRHLRQTVRFADGVGTLLAEGEPLFLEVGPGQTLSTLVMQHPDRPAGQTVINSLRHPRDPQSDDRFLLQALGKLWLAGAAIDWAGFHAGERRRRLRLPTYPFERQLYWVEPRRQTFDDLQRRAAGRKRPDPGDWLYAPSWRRTAWPRPEEPVAASWLLLLDRPDETSLGIRLAERLRELGQRVTTASDSEALLQAVAESGQDLDVVVHLGSVGEGSDGFHGLLRLAQALGERRRPVRIEVFTSAMQSVTGEERLAPEKALVLGPVLVIPQELPQIACRSIDVSLPGVPIDRLAADLLAGLSRPPSPAESIVAYRGAHRWVQGYEAVRLPDGAAAPNPLRPGSVVLITGGLGGVGLALAGHLARTVQAKLVLTGRSPFPVREEIEALGAEVLVVQADVREPAEMRAVLAAARERFGQPVRGVIHAAGVAGGGMVQLKTAAAAEEVLGPKVRGAQVLAEVLGDEPLDLFVLCSAVNSVLGGFGRVDFCAASAFLDAFALQRSGDRDGLTVAIGWDTWSEVGVVAETELPPDLDAVRRESLRHGMSTREGLEVFDRVLRGELPRVVVSTRDLAGLLERQRPVSADGTAASAEISRPAATHGRPALSTTWVAPDGEIERSVAAVWEDFLGIQGIGAHDNFFELGGHSLMATQITTRLRDTFRADFTIARFFAEPTIAGMAAALSRPEPEPTHLARLLDEVEGLSDEELDALLAAEEARTESEELHG